VLTFAALIKGWLLSGQETAPGTVGVTGIEGATVTVTAAATRTAATRAATEVAPRPELTTQSERYCHFLLQVCGNNSQFLDTFRFGDLRCFNCGERGHMSRDCTKERTDSGGKKAPAADHEGPIALHVLHMRP
jgi:hypothetical protein